MYGWALNHAVDLLPQAARQQALTCNCLNQCKLCCLYTLSAAPVPRFNMCARADGWPAPSLQQHMQVALDAGDEGGSRPHQLLQLLERLTVACRKRERLGPPSWAEARD